MRLKLQKWINFYAAIITILSWMKKGGGGGVRQGEIKNQGVGEIIKPGLGVGNKILNC